MRKQLGAAALALILAVVGAGCGGGAAGPLAQPKGSGVSTSGLPVRTHQFALTAIPFIARVFEHPVELLGIRLIHPEDAQGLTIRYAAKTIRGAAIGGARGWRRAARGLKPVPGYLVHAHTPTEIVIGAAAAKAGVYLLRGFVIDYRIGGTHYHAPQQIQLEVCAGMKSCPD